ncbi:unnamed protein product [Closterium sp. NIES-54]
MGPHHLEGVNRTSAGGRRAEGLRRRHCANSARGRCRAARGVSCGSLTHLHGHLEVRDDLYIRQLEEKMTHIWMGNQEKATDYCNRARWMLAEMQMAGAKNSTTYILQDKAMQEAEQPMELLPQANYAAQTKLNQQQGQRRKPGEGGSGGGQSTKDDDEKRSHGTRAEEVVVNGRSVGSATTLTTSPTSALTATTATRTTTVRGRSTSRRPRRDEKLHKEKHMSKKTSSTKDAENSSSKGQGDGEASCSMVGVVEPTVSLTPEAGEDFKAVAATVQANPTAVLLVSSCSHHLMGTKEAFVEMNPRGDVKHVRGFNGALQNVEGRGIVTLRGETLVALRTIASAAKSTPDMWHTRLVHIGIDTIKISAKHEVAVGLDIKPWTAADLPCASCVGGKLARHTFPDQGSDATNTLDVVHIDMCSPFRVAANNDSFFFLLLKERKSRYVWVRRIVKKSDALVVFEKWLKLGILQNLTCPYTPQQNGMAEREMHTVVETVQTMLLHMGVKHNWWHLALRQAVWVRNFLERASLPSGTTLHELMFKKKPDVTLAHVWGCMVQFMVPEQQHGGCYVMLSFAFTSQRGSWNLCLGAEEMSQRSGDAAEKRNEPPPSKIEALDGSNYEEWSRRMRSAFKRYKLLKLAMGEVKMPEEGDARDRWIEKSAVLYDLILQSVNNDIFQHIKNLVELDDSGPKAWKLLRDVIQPNTLPMVIVLEKELAALSMRPGDDVKPVLDKIKDIYARMAAAGSNVSQMQQCTKIISVLDNSWDNLIPTLNTQQDQWTPEWLRQQILQEDFRKCHTGGGAANKTAEGYGAAGGSRGRWEGRGRGRGRGFGRGRGRGDYNEGHVSSDGRGSTRMEGACWYYKKAGHLWFKCFSRPEGWALPSIKPPSGERARGGAVQGSGAQGDGAHGKADPGMFLMVEDMKGSEGDVGSFGKVVMHPLNHWVIDSCCTSHMTPRADLLDEEKPPGKIKFVAAASGALLPVIGVGNAKVMGANGGLVGLGNVLLVEGLSANLLSVRWLQKSNAKVTFGPTSCHAKLGKLLLWDLEEKSSCIKDLWQLPIIPWNRKLPATAAAATAVKETAGGEETAPSDGALDAVKKVLHPQQPHSEVLAGVDATAAWAKASSRSGEADWETWHESLCHVNFPMLQKLVKDGSLKGLEFPFSSGTGPAKASLALVHMDVVGPTRAPSLSGNRYFLTIVDDHTRVVWVYPLKTKGEVAAAVLKEWMPRAQRESGHKVKVIRTDNGGEFIGADFEAVLKKKGIQHQLTVPYNPQQNGVAECFNRTLQEGARTLLGRAGLPDPFRVTALRQVALVKNMVLATVGDKQLIWDLTSQQLIVSSDVKFLESLYYKEWKQQQQKIRTTPLIIEADEVQRPFRQVQVTVSDEEISRVTEDGGEPEVEEQQQQEQQQQLQQQDAPPHTQCPPDRPRRDVRPRNRLTYPSFGKPKVVRVGSVAEQCDEDEIAHCYWAAVPEPKTLAEALSGPDAEKWKQSVKEEYDSLLENETWELCELPPGKKAISSKLIFRHKWKGKSVKAAIEKEIRSLIANGTWELVERPRGVKIRKNRWVLMTKYHVDDTVAREKARLVVKGFTQVYGADYDKPYAPVGSYVTLRIFFSIVAVLDLHLMQLNMKNVFLQSKLDRVLYMY